MTARRETIFHSVHDLARRAGLDKPDLASLARADALASLAGHRRSALWATLAEDSPTALAMPARAEATQPSLLPPTEGQDVTGDYASVGLTLRRHPLAILRGALKGRGLATAGEISGARHGRWVRTSGLVTCRQRPATASGVLFLTLEDETGCVNLVVWNDLVERYRKAVLGARLLAVVGVLQKQQGVVNVLARRFEDLSPLLGTLRTESRDFC